MTKREPRRQEVYRCHCGDGAIVGTEYLEMEFLPRGGSTSRSTWEWDWQCPQCGSAHSGDPVPDTLPLILADAQALKYPPKLIGV